MCAIGESTDEAHAIANFPLFDTPYKMAANYVPVLPLRALSDSDIYRKKGKAHMERRFYVRNLQGKLAEPYESMTVDIDVQGKGFFGRRIIATGKINDYNLHYENDISFRLPKKAVMNVHASLDGCEFLKLDIESDGDKLTNDVKGKFLGREVNYLTEWRNTKGLLSGMEYSLHAEGLTGASTIPCDGDNKDSEYCKDQDKASEEALYRGTANGNIMDFSITGTATELRENYFEIEENYGPILVKTSVEISYE